MLELIEGRQAGAALADAVMSDVRGVCRRIPPLWDLSNYVAVNPFLGFASRPIGEAAAEVGDALGAQVLPELAYYRTKWREGAFDASDLPHAAAATGWDAVDLKAVLDGRSAPPRRPVTTPRTFAERRGGGWHDLLVRQAARWCAVHATGGGATWHNAAGDLGLYASWREAASVDRSPEIAGLRGWRAWARRLPAQPERAVVEMLARLEVPASRREAYLYRLLGGLYGWASYLRRDSWRQGGDDPGALVDLLAIRICGDAAVAELAPTGTDHGTPVGGETESESIRLALQNALENGFVRRLLTKIQPAPLADRSGGRPGVQAVFCIDVRSEPFRRHLETRAPGVETRGFAGFFGVALEWLAEGSDAGHGSARCPVLLNPALRVAAEGAAPAGSGLAPKHLQSAPASAFCFVELLGLGYGLKLAADALGAGGVDPTGRGECHRPFDLEPGAGGAGIPLATRVDLAAGILKNMGLRAPVARLVLLCGHEGRSANNPHAAGLDCGACGGHGGALNARVAAALLNDPAVRAALPARGWPVPDDTRFVAAVHDTSVDQVRLLDTHDVPDGHRADLERLRGWLDEAGALVRRERAAALGLAGTEGPRLDRALERRARDWSETRPEWGLARNAAFIAARRSRTRGSDLEGRAFLHEYDWTADPDGSVLTLILSAPMVVASWINLQYFASTVDNATFGCGTKALHNRVGSLGVVLGNGGDLRTGLAAQSVHGPDGQWFHEPLRLQVLVEAPRDRIDAVLSEQPGVRDLVVNGWVRLFALDPDGPGVARRADGLWEPVVTGAAVPAVG